MGGEQGRFVGGASLRDDADDGSAFDWIAKCNEVHRVQKLRLISTYFCNALAPSKALNL